MCSDCEACGLKKHGLTRSDCISNMGRGNKKYLLDWGGGALDLIRIWSIDWVFWTGCSQLNNYWASSFK